MYVVKDSALNEGSREMLTNWRVSFRVWCLKRAQYDSK